MLRGENRGKWKGRQPLGIEPRTPGLCSQCSTTELRQLDNHQPSCIQDILMFSSNTISLCNIQPYRFSTACALHSFCIQDWPYLPCSAAIVLQQPTTQLTLHTHQHAPHTHEHYPSQCLPPMTSLARKPTQSKMAEDVGMVWMNETTILLNMKVNIH